MVELPIRSSYWAADGFLAGEYPGAWDAVDTGRRLGAFASHDLTLFVDLTHPADGLEPYDGLLELPTRRVAHPIPDMGTTTIPQMTRILDDIDEALAAEGRVYVHCWGGIGRTGMVVGCWLMRHGLDEGDPIGRIASLRRDMEGARPSPETSAQRAMITSWKRGR